MKRASIVLCLLLAPTVFAATATTHLLHTPTMTRSQIVFSSAGDLGLVSGQGGAATRLTAGPGIETLPVFSPDGQTLAFTGEYDGNIDVYTMPAGGGGDKGLPHHPRAAYGAG